MARRRARYFVTDGALVIMRATPRVLVWGVDPPLVLTRKGEAERLAKRAGGYVIRVPGKQKAEFRPWYA